MIKNCLCAEYWERTGGDRCLQQEANPSTHIFFISSSLPECNILTAKLHNWAHLAPIIGLPYFNNSTLVFVKSTQNESLDFDYEQ